MKHAWLAKLAFAAALVAACSSTVGSGDAPDAGSGGDASAPDATTDDAYVASPDTGGPSDDAGADGADAGLDATLGDADSSAQLVFFDDFNRASLDLQQHAWRRPTLDQMAMPDAGPEAGSDYYSIVGNFLQVTGDTQAPGSSALLAMVAVRNGRGSYKQQRTTPLLEDHYTDLVLRYDATDPDGKFYRVRLHEYVEQGGMDRGEVAELAIYRIVSAADQLGHLMNNRAHYWDNPLIGDAGSPGAGSDAGVQSPDIVGYIYPPGPLTDTIDQQCLPSEGHPSGVLPPGDPGCPTMALPDRSVMDRFRLEVSAQGNVIVFKLFGYKEGVAGERLIVSDKITDTSTDAITDGGLWGLAHFRGTSLMDDFKLESFGP